MCTSSTRCVHVVMLKRDSADMPPQWWNPAVEFRTSCLAWLLKLLLTDAAEAMDRIHRLGQHRPVQAIKLVIEDSIESRIVQLQEKKSAMWVMYTRVDNLNADAAASRISATVRTGLYNDCFSKSDRFTAQH